MMAEAHPKLPNRRLTARMSAKAVQFVSLFKQTNEAWPLSLFHSDFCRDPNRDGTIGTRTVQPRLDRWILSEL